MKFKLVENYQLNEDAQTPNEVARDIAIQNGYRATISSKGSLGLEYPCDIYQLRAILLANGIDVGRSTSVRRGQSGYWEWRSYPNVKFVTPNTSILNDRERRERLATLSSMGLDTIATVNGFNKDRYSTPLVYTRSENNSDHTIEATYYLQKYSNESKITHHMELKGDGEYERNEVPIKDIFLKYRFNIDQISGFGAHGVRVDFKSLPLTMKTKDTVSDIIHQNSVNLKLVIQDLEDYFNQINKSVDVDWEED